MRGHSFVYQASSVASLGNTGSAAAGTRATSEAPALPLVCELSAPTIA